MYKFHYRAIIVFTIQISLPSLYFRSHNSLHISDAPHPILLHTN